MNNKKIIREKIHELINIYKDNKNILELGIYNFNNKIDIFVNYPGNGINSIVYNGLTDKIVYLKEYIELYLNKEIYFNSILRKCEKIL